MGLLAKLTDPKVGITFDFYTILEDKNEYDELQLFDAQTIVWRGSLGSSNIGKATIGASEYFYINTPEIMSDFSLSKISGVQDTYDIFAIRGKYYKGEYGLEQDIDKEWFIFPRTFANKIIPYDHYLSVRINPNNSGTIASLVGGTRACTRIPFVEEVHEYSAINLKSFSGVELKWLHNHLLRFEHVIQHEQDENLPEEDKYYIRVLYYKPTHLIWKFLKDVNTESAFIDVTFKNSPRKTPFEDRFIDLFVGGYTSLNDLSPQILLNA
jgi:hypothetical protein